MKVLIHGFLSVDFLSQKLAELILVFIAFLGFLRIFMHKIMLCYLWVEMVSLLPLWSVCLFFSCLIALARISKRVLNRSGESRHPYFVSYLSGKVLSRFTVKYDFVGFPWMPFQRLRKFPSTCLLTVFHMKICCILSNAYSVSIQSCDSFSFVLFNMAFYTDSFFRCSMNLTLRDKSHLLIVCNPFKNHVAGFDLLAFLYLYS